jgi:hypothetical protein
MMTIFYTVSRESDKPIYYAETCKSFSYFLFSNIYEFIDFENI